MANNFSSDQIECASQGKDFEDILFEQAEANMLKESFGMKTEKTVENVPPAQPAEDTEDLATGEPKDETKPKPKKKARLSSTTRL